MGELKYIHIIIILIVILVALFFVGDCKVKCSSNEEEFDHLDSEKGNEAVKELEKLLSEGKHIEEITDEELEEISDDIFMAKLPDEKEELSYWPGFNRRYWPRYYYSWPNNYRYGGAWPPGLYSRLRFWSPGYYTGSGWNYYLRPGLRYRYWPRNRWVRHTKGGKHSYYYVSNKGDYKHGAANYSGLPLYYY